MCYPLVLLAGLLAPKWAADPSAQRLSVMAALCIHLLDATFGLLGLEAKDASTYSVTS